MTRLLELMALHAQMYSGRDLKYQSFYDLVAVYGRSYTPVERPRKVKKGVPQHCYYNATQVAKKGFYTYCEGFYVSDQVPFPVTHAWLTDGTGNAIDPTLGYQPENNQEYFGVALTFDFVKWHQSVSREAAIFESDHIHRYKLLKEGFPAGAAPEPSDLDTISAQLIKAKRLYRVGYPSNGLILVRERPGATPALRTPTAALLQLWRTLHKVAEKC